MIVDASVLGDDGECGRQARDLHREHRELAAPDLVDVQTTAILRRRWLAGTITDRRFEQAVEDLTDIPLARFATLGLMRRPSSGANVTAHDACYVALAEALDWWIVERGTRARSRAGRGSSTQYL